MEKVKKGHSISYPMLSLFKEDLEQIFAAIEKDHKDAEIIIDEYKLTNSTEIDQIKKPVVTNLSAQFFQRYPQETPYRSELLTLTLKENRASLTISDENDTHLRGIMSQIDSVLARRKSKLNFLTSSLLYIPLTFICSIIAFYITSLPYSFHKEPSLTILLTLLVVALFVVPIVLGIGAFQIRTKRYTIIHLSSINSQSNFFNRNKDDIAKMALGSIITVVTGGIVYLINWLVHLLH